MKNKSLIFKSKYAVAILFTIVSLGAFVSACKEDDDDGGTTPTTGYMQMEMTDTPANYLNVYVDIKSVEVHVSADTTNPNGWTALNTRDTIYDLLTLQNDITAVLADSTVLPTGKITQMRLILGSRNSVVLLDSSVHALVVPSGEKTGIKINLNTTIEPNKTTRVLIDFDADQSITLQGNGEYKLSPVIKIEKIEVE